MFGLRSNINFKEVKGVKSVLSLTDLPVNIEGQIEVLQGGIEDRVVKTKKGGRRTRRKRRSHGNRRTRHKRRHKRRKSRRRRKRGKRYTRR